MDPLRKTVIRLLVYGVALGWIAGDLFVWHGFLRQRIDRADPNSPEAIARAKSQGVVARVFNHRITRGQLERAIAERLWKEGKNPEELDADTTRMVRYAALNDLIDHELLRVKAKAHGPDLRIDPRKLEERYRRFRSRFSSEREMLDAANRQGIASSRELRERIAAWMQQEAYVESKISGITEIDETELRKWWLENQAEFANPERAEVRHIFQATLGRDTKEVENRMKDLLRALRRGDMTFESAARAHSEDPASKDRGGSLGWISKGRLPDDFTQAVFSIPLTTPTLVRTSTGWHILETTARMEREPRSWEQAGDEARAAWLTVRRNRAIREYKSALRQFEAHKIQVFDDRMEW